MLSNGMRGRGLGRGAPPVSVPAPHATPAPHGAPEPAPSHHETSSNSLPPEFLDYIEAMGQNIGLLREQLGEVRGELHALNHRGADSQRVFDALHHELNDYKRDFIYEHMKPLLRPLLFLYDSLEGFDQEMKLYEENQQGQTLAPDALRGTKVRQNIGFLRDQLVQALEVCEVEPLAPPSGHFDPKTQKAIDTVAVAPEQDGTIAQVLRVGWTMNGHLLRPAEVVLGKAKSQAAKSVSEGESP
jgi:molecular chaperone GrpE (heat shock protein)